MRRRAWTALDSNHIQYLRCGHLQDSGFLENLVEATDLCTLNKFIRIVRPDCVQIVHICDKMPIEAPLTYPNRALRWISNERFYWLRERACLEFLRRHLRNRKGFSRPGHHRLRNNPEPPEFCNWSRSLFWFRPMICNEMIVWIYYLSIYEPIDNMVKYRVLYFVRFGPPL